MLKTIKGVDAMQLQRKTSQYHPVISIHVQSCAALSCSIGHDLRLPKLDELRPGNASESWKLWKLCLGTRTLAERLRPGTWYLDVFGSGSLKPSSQQFCWDLKSSQYPKPLSLLAS